MPGNTTSPVIVVHEGELRNMEQTGAKIVRELIRHHGAARFTIKIPERDNRPLTSGDSREDI